MSNLLIKEITQELMPQCVSLYMSVFSQEPWNETWEPEGTTERLTCYLNSPNSITLGAFYDDKIVGLIQGSHEPYQLQRAFFVKELCVSNSFQGEGVGTALWNELEQRCKEINVTNISLLTLRNTPAEIFYIKKQCQLDDSIRLYYKEM